jgi:hypothetical protein
MLTRLFLVLLVLTVSTSVFNDPSLGQTAVPTPSPTNEPLTRQATESSTEITPADRRVMSDIQEIRAMLGGGLEREFEEINQVLRQPPASMAPSTHPSQDNSSAGKAAIEGRATTEGDWFSRELGQMVRERAKALPSSRDPRLHQPERSIQPITRQGDKRTAMRQCARELELVAGTLEQIEAYENADAVRREAVQLWEKARKSEPVTHR